jgi:hypothetical protein
MQFLANLNMARFGWPSVKTRFFYSGFTENKLPIGTFDEGASVILQEMMQT